LNERNLFLIINGVCSCYFSGIMSRLMLTVAPIISVLAGIGFSVTIERLLLRIPAPEPEKKEKELLEESEDVENEDEIVEKEAEKEEKLPTDWLFFVRNHPLPLKLL
jgi:hypothetical protein